MDELTIAFKIESPPSWLPIGRTAENNWRTVEIDCSYWFNMNANGEVVLMYKPSCGMSPYPLLTERDGDNIIWRPKSGELVEGVGRLQAFFEVGTDVIGSSDMISCEVDSSLLGVDPGTDPGQTDLPWALDIIEQIAELSGHYPKIIDGDLYIWDSTLNDWVEFEASGGAVESVNGKTGVVVLDASDVGAYVKPSTGIPASDLASGVIPSVPQMATQTNMSDWTGGKTVDAAVLKANFQGALQALENVGDAVDYHASEIGNLQTDKADKTELPDASTSAPVMDGTAAVGTSDAYARADHVHPSDTTRLSATGNAYRSASIPMGHLDATSTATVMTATVDGITELRDGVCMWLRNGVITSASGFTLNVNGLGAKPCYSSLAEASRSTTIFNVNYTMLFVYNSTRVDGGCWDIVYGVDTNTTYTPVKLGFGYGTCTTAAATAAKTASISSYALTTGGIVSIKFDNDVPANATLNITSKGAKAIYHRGAAITAGVIKAGDTATFVYSTYYHLIAIDRDESGDVLPSVTASDNGKVLGVVNGEWSVKSDEGGASVAVDDALSTTSENPVQNKVITVEVDGLKSNLGILLEPEQSVNFFNGAFESGYRAYTEGTVMSSNTYIHSAPIALSAGGYLFPSTEAQFGAANGRMAWVVDKNGNVLSSISGTVVGAKTQTGKYANRNIVYFTMPSDGYVSMNIGVESAVGQTVNQVNNFMIVRGDSIADFPDYVPYSAGELVPKQTIGLTKKMVSQVNGLAGLIGKTAIFDGDSICAGTSVGDSEPTRGYGWAGRIGIANEMKWKNFGVDGGVITSASNASVSDKHSVCDNVDTMYAQYPNADFIIFEGGTNDADKAVTIGDVAENDFSGTYDATTFCGALNTIFYKATSYWKGKEIGYIVAHKMGRGANNRTTRAAYFAVAKSVCAKWGIPVLDLWDGCYLNPDNPNMWNQSLTKEQNITQGYLYTDGQHLTAKGYDYISPMIEDWMKGI